MARAANTGVTCFVDSRGEVTHRLPRLEEGVLSANVSLPSAATTTVYARIGDAFSITSLAVAAIVAIECLVRRRSADSRACRAA
jgi:apolipoprotein N-acyltransferase